MSLKGVFFAYEFGFLFFFFKKRASSVSFGFYDVVNMEVIWVGFFVFFSPPFNFFYSMVTSVGILGETGKFISSFVIFVPLFFLSLTVDVELRSRGG